jgi:hypothetical protein
MPPASARFLSLTTGFRHAAFSPSTGIPDRTERDAHNLAEVFSTRPPVMVPRGTFALGRARSLAPHRGFRRGALARASENRPLLQTHFASHRLSNAAGVSSYGGNDFRHSHDSPPFSLLADGLRPAQRKHERAARTEEI